MKEINEKVNFRLIFKVKHHKCVTRMVMTGYRTKIRLFIYSEK